MAYELALLMASAPTCSPRPDFVARETAHVSRNRSSVSPRRKFREEYTFGLFPSSRQVVRILRFRLSVILRPDSTHDRRPAIKTGRVKPLRRISD